MDKNQKRTDPVPSGEPTMCSVCAWRIDCIKKFTYAQGSPVKCADFTRDAALPKK